MTPPPEGSVDRSKADRLQTVNASTSNGHPPAAAVRHQLERILASESFVNAGRLSRFLRFVVEGTLEGRGDRLKEYAVGIEVFDRDADYDPRIDSIVRVEARRLRSKLVEYYATSGEADELVIGLRKGSYVPYFEPRATTSLQQAAFGAPADATKAPLRSARWPSRRGLAAVALGALVVGVIGWTALQPRSFPSQPPADPRTLSVAVLPLEHFSTDPQSSAIAQRITDGLTSELARFPALTVRSRTSALQFAGARPAIVEVARALEARFLVEGSVLVADGIVRVDARVVDGANDRKVWVHDVSGPEADIPALQRQMAAAIANYLAARAKG